MKELGFIPNPEQYVSAADLLLTEDSIDAADFFEEYYGTGGVVFLCNIVFNSLKYPILPFWAYVKLSTQEIIALLPVLKVDDYAEVFKAKQIHFIPIMSEALFYWKNNLLSSVFTSTGEIVIKKKLSLWEQKDVIAFMDLNFDYEVTDVYPVRVYSVTRNQLICVCWAVEMDDIDALLYQPVYLDDAVRVKQFEGDAFQDLGPLEFFS